MSFRIWIAPPTDDIGLTIVFLKIKGTTQNSRMIAKRIILGRVEDLQ
jgi:hypothetical protein